MPAAKAAPQAVNKEAATISGASTVAKRIPAPQVRSGFACRLPYACSGALEGCWSSQQQASMQCSCTLTKCGVTDEPVWLVSCRTRR